MERGRETWKEGGRGRHGRREGNMEGGRETWKEGGREREGDMEGGRENLRQVRPEKATAMCKEYQRSPLLVQG